MSINPWKNSEPYKQLIVHDPQSSLMEFQKFFRIYNTEVLNFAYKIIQVRDKVVLARTELSRWP
jgi:hypothetical protein